MKEFLFFIMSEGKPLANASPEEMQQHIRKVGDYIRKNVKEGKFHNPLKVTESLSAVQREIFLMVRILNQRKSYRVIIMSLQKTWKKLWKLQSLIRDSTRRTGVL